MASSPSPGRDPDYLGVPGLGTLMDASDAERHALRNMMAAADAESAILTAQMAGLTAREQRARRREAAAKGLVTRARKDGSAEKIAAAVANYDKARAEADAEIGACLDQMHQVTRAGIASLGTVLDQELRASEAGNAVIRALCQPPDGPGDATRCREAPSARGG